MRGEQMRLFKSGHNTLTYNARINNSPVFTAANNAKKPMAYMIDFFLSNLPGRNIQAVAGCTMKT